MDSVEAQFHEPKQAVLFLEGQQNLTQKDEQMPNF
jgi:hypothetical protein